MRRRCRSYGRRSGARGVSSTLGSAHDDAEVETLKAAARQRIAAGQAELDLGLEPADGGSPPITSSRMGCLLYALERAYQGVGLEVAAGGASVFRDLVLARIISPRHAGHDGVGATSDLGNRSGSPAQKNLPLPGREGAGDGSLVSRRTPC